MMGFISPYTLHGKRFSEGRKENTTQVRPL